MDYQNRKGSTNRAWYGLAAAGVTFILWTVLKPAATVAPIPIVRKVRSRTCHWAGRAHVPRRRL
jgi:hypothetical protein